MAFHSCKRQDGFIKSNPINQDLAKEWLHKNGLAYKDEAISIKDKLAGKLNWEKASQYNWQGRDYIDIPYEFDGQPYIGGDNGPIINAFNLVIRKSQDGNHEAALRTATYGISINSEDDNSEVLQSYVLINGTKSNVWYSDLQHQNPKLSREDITKNEFLQLMSNRKTVSRSVEGDDCSYTAVYTYTNCNYSVGDTVVVMLCPTTTYLKICSDLPPTTVPGTIFPPIGVGVPSPGGGGTTPGSTTSNDPCASAAIAIAKLNNTYQTLGINDSIKKFTNVPTNLYEQGFMIVEKRKYEDMNTWTSTYYTSPVETSTSETSISLTYQPKYNEYTVGLIHTHPAKGSAGASAADIYNMAVRGYDYITNVMDPQKVNYLGDFIVAADGSIYGLAVTNNTFAYNFYNTKSSYLDTETAGWKEKSKAGDIFAEAYNTFYIAYDGNSNQKNLAYEAAMAETLNKLNSGITMVKYNPTTGSFEPVVQNVIIKKDSFGDIEKDAAGNPKTTTSKRC